MFWVSAVLLVVIYLFLFFYCSFIVFWKSIIFLGEKSDFVLSVTSSGFLSISLCRKIIISLTICKPLNTKHLEKKKRLTHLIMDTLIISVLVNIHRHGIIQKECVYLWLWFIHSAVPQHFCTSHCLAIDWSEYSSVSIGSLIMTIAQVHLCW